MQNNHLYTNELWGTHSLLDVLCHLLYVRRFTDSRYEYGPDDFIPLTMSFLKTYANNAPSLIHSFIDAGYLESDNHYVVGEKSKGYRIADPSIRNSTHTLKTACDNPIHTKLVARRLDQIKYPVLRFLRNNLEQVSLKPFSESLLMEVAEGVETRAINYRQALQALTDHYHFFVVDFAKTGFGSRRVFTNLTCLKREFRPLLQVDGDSLMQIDLKASQLLMLAIGMMKAGYDCEAFLRDCEDDLYQCVADKANCTRAEVKAVLCCGALFAKNSSPYQYTHIMKVFKAMYPSAYEYMTKTKMKDHKKLALELQGREANIIVYTICERIRKEQPDCFLSTIHDSILFKPEHAEYVQGIMRDTFSQLGVKPKLEVKTLAE